MQETRSVANWYPSTQVQTKLPSVFTHSCAQGPSSHSFSSERSNKTICNYLSYLTSKNYNNWYNTTKRWATEQFICETVLNNSYVKLYWTIHMWNTNEQFICETVLNDSYVKLYWTIHMWNTTEQFICETVLNNSYVKLN